MAINYAYKYAIIRDLTNGLCLGTQDTSNYILNPAYVPIEDDDAGYELNYYWPIPSVVNSFADFQGKWYTDAEHQNEATHLNV